MGACWTVATQSICLPIFYHSFLHACWCCSSLSAIPACMVSHYQPFLLVWSLIICHALWCDVSLSAMPSGVLSHHRPRLLVWSLIIPHYQPCPLVWRLTIGHVCWSVAIATDIFTSYGATCTEVSSHQTCLLNWAQNYNASLKLRTT